MNQSRHLLYASLDDWRLHHHAPDVHRLCMCRPPPMCPPSPAVADLPRPGQPLPTGNISSADGFRHGHEHRHGLLSSRYSRAYALEVESALVAEIGALHHVQWRISGNDIWDYAVC